MLETASPATSEPQQVGKQKVGSRRRQFGAERITDPLSIMHSRPSTLKILLGRAAILIVIFSWTMYVVTTVVREFIENSNPTLRIVLETCLYLLVVTALAFSALVYIITRQGALYRFRDHARVPRAVIDRHFDGEYERGITMLIPSYVEDLRIVATTLWSAALQEFPQKHIVLLIDDPPIPTDPARRAELDATRALPGEIERELAEPAARLREARDSALARINDDLPAGERELRLLAEEYRYAALWLETKAANHPVIDHTDKFFIDRILVDLAGDLRLTLFALEAAADQGDGLEIDRVRQLYTRLVRIFTVRADSFERKAYLSLSQEANKAMNLNSYITLMGKRWKRVETGDGVALLPAADSETADLTFPDSEYLLTLDADSMLLRDYCARLVYLLEEPGNERIAVTQTPYSSFRGAPTRIERIAAATTDIQHILHQGMSYYNATFWVGANAVIRKRALEDIVQSQVVGGHTINTYVQDRTVIEDTESTIDLGTHDWQLMNYPERLSYSATPPDFGSLVVQRRRWANGGLLILPKYFNQLRVRRKRGDRIMLREILLRVNYMASIAWASLGLILLLGYPFDSRLLSLWVIAAALPYFLCMSQDLKDSGYRRSDVFRIYGFNLVLLAVNVAGTLKSIQQSFTNDKIPFARTPKVSDRTPSPGIYVLAPLAIITFSLIIAWLDFRAQNWGNLAFALFNAILAGWAVIAYIGIWNSIVDMWFGFLGFFFVPEERLWRERRAKRRATAARPPRRTDPNAAVDWRSILHYGDRRLDRDLRRKDDLRRRFTPRR
ncbi:MAG: glycosyltransferase family 2 protein [Leucobacter sp.]